MEIPDEFITLGAMVVGGLISRSIYGLIERNKTDSDAADVKGDEKMAKVEARITQIDEKYREIDREQYKLIGDIREEQAYVRGLREKN